MIRKNTESRKEQDILDMLGTAQKIKKMTDSMLFHNNYSEKALQQIKTHTEIPVREIKIVERAIHLRQKIVANTLTDIEIWIAELENKYGKETTDERTKRRM